MKPRHSETKPPISIHIISMLQSLDILNANLAKLFSSRLSRNRHISLERSLVTITQGVSSLSMQRHSELAGTVSSTVLAVQSDGTASCAEVRDAKKLLAGNLQPVQSDLSVPGGFWRQHPWVKRTLRVEKSVTEYFLATLRAESNTKLQISRDTNSLIPFCEQDQYEHETSYTVYPAPWLIRLGLQYGLRLKFHSSSTQGWKTALKAFCPVPDDALIFEFCEQGNVPAVRSLLSGGHASVRDTDSRGYTPLHVSHVAA